MKLNYANILVGTSTDEDAAKDDSVTDGDSQTDGHAATGGDAATVQPNDGSEGNGKLIYKWKF